MHASYHPIKKGPSRKSESFPGGGAGIPGYDGGPFIRTSFLDMSPDNITIASSSLMPARLAISAGYSYAIVIYPARETSSGENTILSSFTSTPDFILGKP